MKSKHFTDSFSSVLHFIFLMLLEKICFRSSLQVFLGGFLPREAIEMKDAVTHVKGRLMKGSWFW